MTATLHICCLFIIKAVFLHGVLATLASSPWPPVPSMYWLAALASVNKPSLRGTWDETTLTIALQIMNGNFLLSDRRIRQATCHYLLMCVLNLCEVRGQSGLFDKDNAINLQRNSWCILFNPFLAFEWKMLHSKKKYWHRSGASWLCWSMPIDPQTAVSIQQTCLKREIDSLRKFLQQRVLELRFLASSVNVFS